MYLTLCIFRTNKGRSRLTGALTGLGPARSRNELHGKLSLAEKTEAFFPEHDLETRFDVEINNEDLDLVNKIRYWMNVCLSKTHPDQIMRLTQPISLDKAQKGIKAAMEALLLEDRKVVEKEGRSVAAMWKTHTPISSLNRLCDFATSTWISTERNSASKVSLKAALL